jgi:hypothetical protein
VLEVSKVKQDTKRKVDACGGLGYLDMKIAFVCNSRERQVATLVAA